MKNSRPRFPFIINNYEHKEPASSLEKIVSLNEENGEKISALLKKIGFLESSLDGFFDLEKSETDMEVFFKELVPVTDSLDSLRRAVEDSGEEEWKKGVGFLYEKLFHIFSRFDFTLSAHAGMTFDPTLHEAVGVDDSSTQQPNTITEVIENGWLYKKRVVRFAKVIVAKDREQYG